MFGFLNVCKPKGMTSHDVVAVLRKITKVKQIGHTGTLDPFAEGVLPVCVGKATRLIEYLNDEKAYIGTVQLGSSTDTYDVEGNIVKTSDKTVSFEEVEDALENFRGEIEQVPPMYSALKVNGKKLYEYARAGESVDIKPRKITINRIDLLSYDEINNRIELFIDCSKGTYIRSIANDLGEELGTYGHLIKLERVKAGKFTIRNSVKLEELKTSEDVENHLIQPIGMLDLPKYELSLTEFERVSHGMSIKLNMQNGRVVFVSENKIVAVADVEKNTAKINKVFV